VAQRADHAGRSWRTDGRRHRPRSSAPLSPGRLGGNVFPGGSLQGANSENWPILVGQKGAVYLARLAVGGIREPYWHPSAWEVNVILAGRSRWVFVGPNGTQDVFEAGKGDVIFAPQGHYHYFENASATEELVALIVFNSDAAEPKDDIGIGQSLTAIPNDVLSAVLGVPVSTFEQIPTVPGRIVIVKRPEGQTGPDRQGRDCAVCRRHSPIPTEPSSRTMV
jgi:oxalate decarboxylase